MNRIAEALFLLAACYLVFFTGLGRHDYIKTEGLRAVVVEEMLEREGLSMPTVHQRPYLKKPPLYAWTTTTLARLTGQFDERIARLPSAVCGTLFVFLMYLLGERWVGCGGGLTAAVLTLMLPTVSDYAIRAELDLPFGLFCTACLALTITALRTQGAVRAASWLGAYAIALVAGMWKGPHSLIFMWLTMFGFGRLTRDWSFLKSAAQWSGLILAMGVLTWWAKALSAFAGAADVGRTAGIELLVRLVPYKPDHFLSILTFVPLLVVITLPASAFALLSFLPDARGVCGLGTEPLALSGAWHRRLIGHLRDWWRAMSTTPCTQAILVWLVPNLVFMTIAPAKAPRYSIPIFAPVILLGCWMAMRLGAQVDVGGPRRHVARTWRAVFIVFAAVGLFAIVRLAASAAEADLGLGRADDRLPWVVLAAGCILPLVVELTARSGRTHRVRLVLALVAFLSLQPVLHGVWWPLRVAGDTQRDISRRIDEIVPAGVRLYVLGKREYPDTQLYSARSFEFVTSIDHALAASDAEVAYAIVPSRRIDKWTADASASYTVVFEFERADKNHVFIKITD